MIQLLTGPEARKFQVALLGAGVLFALRWLQVDYAEVVTLLTAAGVWKAGNEPADDDGVTVVQALVVIALVLAILWLVGIQVEVN